MEAGGKQAKSGMLRLGFSFRKLKGADARNPPQGLKPAIIEFTLGRMDLKLCLVYPAFSPTQRRDLNFGTAAERHAPSLLQPAQINIGQHG